MARQITTQPTAVNKPALSDANSIVEEQLGTHLKSLEECLEADVVSYLGGIISPADDFIRNAVESRKKKRNKLAMVLETPGGYIEVAQRIADTLRHHYETVVFIIPNYAMSAGTVLVMSGDAIYMDYYSTLGPIDPQVERPSGGMMIPALGYLVQYERLIEKSKKGELSTAELAFLIQKFDPAELYRYEQERELSVALLKRWLVNYKFKNWVITETRRLPVTPKMRARRASQVAKRLSQTERWHTHSHGISMEVMRRDLKVQIEDFGHDNKLNSRVRNYYKLLTDYMLRRSHSVVVHIVGKYFGFAIK